MKSLLLILVGLLIIIFSRPVFLRPLMNRLFNEGLVTPQKPKPEKSEILKHAGPNLSLFIIGAILIFIGILLFVYS